MGRLSFCKKDTLFNLSAVFYHKALTALQRERKATDNDKRALNPDLLHVRCVHFEEKITACNCVFTLNPSLIKNCARTPSTGHYIPDTPLDF